MLILIYEESLCFWLVFLIVGASILIYNHNNRSVTVTMNDEGFSPDKIVIRKGTTVTWNIGGKRPHWPTSNPHPKHGGYPEGGGCSISLFDACRSLNPGEQYSFQFNNLGVWGVHDHLLPGLVMVVEVVDKLSSGEVGDKNTLTQNIMSSDEFRKLNYGKQMEIIKSMVENDPSLTWTYLKETFIINGQVVGNVHDFAHIVGNKAFDDFGLDGVKICDENFAFGCFHGVTEKMLMVGGLSSVKAIEEGCLKIFPVNESTDYASCIHGTGHGIYSFEGGYVKKSLLDCDIISEPHRQYCYDGVFMENASFAKGKTFDPKNPWKFCTDLDEMYRPTCARYLGQTFFSHRGVDSLSVVSKNCSLAIVLRKMRSGKNLKF